MATKDAHSPGWLVRRMEELDRESDSWPDWKRDALEEQLERNDIRPKKNSDHSGE